MEDASFTTPQEAVESLRESLDPDRNGRAQALFDWFSSREEKMAQLEFKAKKQQIDFSTVIEIANQVNSKGLDLKRIEGYVISMLRGQFGVVRTFVMRQEHPDDEVMVVTAPAKAVSGTVDFKLDGPLAELLTERGGPVLRNDLESSKDGIPELEGFLEAGVELLVPLIHSGAREGKNLKGLMALGAKITRQPFRDADLSLLTVLGDMIAISLHNAQLYHRSIVDGLTKVYSRGHFDVHLFQEISRARRYIQRDETEVQKDEDMNKYVSLVMVDIDYFKRFNDTYGHQLGDKVLQDVAQVLHASVRSMDIVARYGGEEFAVVFPETRKEDALHIAERLRSSVEQIPIHEDTGDDAKVTISLGVATFPGDAEAVRELINRADKALYSAKSEGRNRVCDASTLVEDD